MPDVATPAAPNTSSQTANNIAKSISDRVNGKAPAAAPPPINGQQPQQPPVDPSAQQAGKERYVVNGKEVWVTPEERAVWVQKGMGYEPRMDELARIKQETNQLLNSLMTDPGPVLANIAKQRNVPVESLVQKILSGNASQEMKEAVGKWFYEEAVEPSRMTPEQLKAREDARWRQERENQDKLSQENAVRAENQRKFVAAMGHLKAQIGEAMAESGLPDNNTPLGAEMAWMVAKVMQLADKQRRTMTPKQAIELVKQHRIRSVQTNYYEAMLDKDENGENIAKELGDKIVGKIQKYLLWKARGEGQGGGNPPPPNPPRIPKRTVRDTINEDQFHDYLDTIKRTGTVPNKI